MAAEAAAGVLVEASHILAVLVAAEGKGIPLLSLLFLSASPVAAAAAGGTAQAVEAGLVVPVLPTSALAEAAEEGLAVKL